MIHCTPVEESERSPCSSGIAIATIVWSMNVIETAKIIAARIRFLLRAPQSSTRVTFIVGARLRPGHRPYTDTLGRAHA